MAVDSYYRHDGEWLWVSGDTTMLLHEADTVAAFLRRQAEDMGFGGEAFFSGQVLSGISHFRRLDFDSTGTSVAATMAAIELCLSKGIVRYAMGQCYGFTTPESLLNPKGERRVYDIADERPADDFLGQVFRHRGEAGHASQRDDISLADQLDKMYPTRLRSSVSVDHVPVVIDYYTLYPNPETGRWETWRDRYEYDKAIIDYIKPLLP